MQETETFDYIIVGAGSAGCVLANRLTACGRHRVLSAGSRSRNRHPWLHVPLGYGKLFTDRRFNWCYETEPQPGMSRSCGHCTARKGCRRIKLDQWADLYPGRPRISTIGANSATSAGASTMSCPISASQRQRARSGSVSWRCWPAGRFERPRRASARSRLCRGGTAMRLSAQPRFQRRFPRGGGPVPDHHAKRIPMLGCHGLSQACAPPAQI